MTHEAVEDVKADTVPLNTVLYSWRVTVYIIVKCPPPQIQKPTKVVAPTLPPSTLHGLSQD